MIMNQPIRIAIVGYGNLGRGVEAAVARCPDMSLSAIYSRRPAASIQTLFGNAPVYEMEALNGRANETDVFVLCGGSKEDLPRQGPQLAALGNTVDSFDTHARIAEYFSAMDEAARAAGHTSIISVGWDPGLFSIHRVLGEAFLPDGDTYTFWGKGVSQGHSDALRRVEGVADGVQYTVPIERAIEQVRSGVRPRFSPRQMHRRECFVVLKDGANADAVRQAIVSMPHYFDEYKTVVTIVDARTLDAEHRGMAHGGFVIRSGRTGSDHEQRLELGLSASSNPELTSSILVAYARAAVRLHRMGKIGAHSVFDVAPGWLSLKSNEQLRAEWL